MRSGTGRGRQGPGLLGATSRPAVLPGSPAPASGRVSAPTPETRGEDGTGDARPHEEVPPGQSRVDSRQGRWLPRHQPWNAASIGRTGRSMDELSAQLEELGELRQAGLLTEEQFARRRAGLLDT
jgi:Short C-terminal domain